MKLEIDDVHDYLPNTVKELVQLIGMSNTLLLVEQRGGIKLYIPNQARSDHWLCELIGIASLHKLVDYFGAGDIDIPVCAEALRATREIEIMKKSEAGISQSKLAREYGYTQRGIEKLLARARVIHRHLSTQNTLF